MQESHKLALYVSYYLARFNNEALQNLGYSTWNQAFDDISEKLQVKKQSVKNWRDEFDPLFQHRAGWYQRPMTPSRVRVAQALESLEESQIQGIIRDILSGNIESDEEAQLLNVVNEEKSNNHVFALRGPTGKAAEELFIKHHANTGEPIVGRLTDCRDLCGGYDFKIEDGKTECYVEVKGLSGFTGGILFTDKEWTTAIKEQDRYYVCLVSDLNNDPVVTFIQNPVIKLFPKKNLYTTIQISWSISQCQLSDL